MKKLSVRQYATHLGISRQAVLKKIKLNKLPRGVIAEKIDSTWIITIKKTKV